MARGMGAVIMFYVIFNTIRESLQMYLQRWNYMLDLSNMVSCLLYVSATAMVLPIFSEHITWLIVPYAATTIFLSWFNLLLYLQRFFPQPEFKFIKLNFVTRFDIVGIYVVMFLEILQTLLRVLLVFSILIIAFGLAFYILLPTVGYKPR